MILLWAILFVHIMQRPNDKKAYQKKTPWFSPLDERNKLYILIMYSPWHLYHLLCLVTDLILFKSVNIAHLTLASFDLTHAVSFPKYPEWQLLLCSERATEKKRTNLAILSRAICKREHRKNLVRPGIDDGNNGENRPCWTAAGVVYQPCPMSYSQPTDQTHSPQMTLHTQPLQRPTADEQ